MRGKMRPNYNQNVVKVASISSSSSIIMTLIIYKLIFTSYTAVIRRNVGEFVPVKAADWTVHNVFTVVVEHDKDRLQVCCNRRVERDVSTAL